MSSSHFHLHKQIGFTIFLLENYTHKIGGWFNSKTIECPRKLTQAHVWQMYILESNKPAALMLITEE